MTPEQVPTILAARTPGRWRTAWGLSTVVAGGEQDIDDRLAFSAEVYGLLHRDNARAIALAINLSDHWMAVAEAARAVLANHQPDPDGGMGRRDDGSYGVIDPACRVCGTSEEYAVPWPCLTATTLTAALAALDTAIAGETDG